MRVSAVLHDIGETLADACDLGVVHGEFRTPSATSLPKIADEHEALEAQDEIVDLTEIRSPSIDGAEVPSVMSLSLEVLRVGVGHRFVLSSLVEPSQQRRLTVG
jgi:hypothetical protein